MESKLANLSYKDDHFKFKDEKQELQIRENDNLLITSRKSLKTADIIPPGHCQLINIIINQSPSKYTSIKINTKFLEGEEDYHSAEINSLYNGKFHKPEIRDTYGLHSSRPIFNSAFYITDYLMML